MDKANKKTTAEFILSKAYTKETGEGYTYISRAISDDPRGSASSDKETIEGIDLNREIEDSKYTREGFQIHPTVDAIIKTYYRNGEKRITVAHVRDEDYEQLKKRGVSEYIGRIEADFIINTDTQQIHPTSEKAYDFVIENTQKKGNEGYLKELYIRKTTETAGISRQDFYTELQNHLMRTQTREETRKMIELCPGKEEGMRKIIEKTDLETIADLTESIIIKNKKNGLIEEATKEGLQIADIADQLIIKGTTPDLDIEETLPKLTKCSQTLEIDLESDVVTKQTEFTECTAKDIMMKASDKDKTQIQYYAEKIWMPSIHGIGPKEGSVQYEALATIIRCDKEKLVKTTKKANEIGPTPDFWIDTETGRTHALSKNAIQMTLSSANIKEVWQAYLEISFKTGAEKLNADREDSRKLIAEAEKEGISIQDIVKSHLKRTNREAHIDMSIKGWEFIELQMMTSDNIYDNIVKIEKNRENEKNIKTLLLSQAEKRGVSRQEIAKSYLDEIKKKAETNTKGWEIDVINRMSPDEIKRHAERAEKMKKTRKRAQKKHKGMGI